MTQKRYIFVWEVGPYESREASMTDSLEQLLEWKESLDSEDDFSIYDITDVPKKRLITTAIALVDE